jgi:hypothetical protein
MSADAPSHLEIHLYTVDGSVHRFYTDDEAEGARIMRNFNPSKLFIAKQFVIAGSFFMSAFQSDEVVRVDFVGSRVRAAEDTHDQREFTQIPEEEMERHTFPTALDTMRADQAIAPGDEVEVHGEFSTREGGRVCCRITARAAGKLDQLQLIQNLASGHGLVINREKGDGLIVLNPAMIARWALYPGFPEAPANAWKMHRVHTKK